MKNILFLATRMCNGFGVSVEIENLALQLKKIGIKVLVACEITDGTFGHLDVVEVEAVPALIAELARSLTPCVVVAHTSPFFEQLPYLIDEFDCWVWENGDPHPDLFYMDSSQRHQIVAHKALHVYPAISNIVVISDFIKHDIGVKDANTIYCGCDHAPLVEPKKKQNTPFSSMKPLKVGTLMRLGAGEACYKGNEAFVDLVLRAKRKGLPVQFHVAGRGEAEDKIEFETHGIIPHLNLSEEMKYSFLRELDLFVSFSLWEGFNLPLVEAQAMGTLSLALDCGAHPEVCPFILNSPAYADQYLIRAVEDPLWLYQQSELCYRYVRSKFSWNAAADAVVRLML